MFMGIDPSTKTGVVILDRKGNVKYSGEVTSDKKDFDRVVDLALQVQELGGKYKVKHVAIEGYAYMNKWTLATLVEIGTMIRYHLRNQGYDYLVVAPSAVKKFTGGKGNLKKDQMMLAVYKNWGFEGTDNECDAAALAHIARCYNGVGREDYTRHQQSLF